MRKKWILLMKKAKLRKRKTTKLSGILGVIKTMENTGEKIEEGEAEGEAKAKGENESDIC